MDTSQDPLQSLWFESIEPLNAALECPFSNILDLEPVKHLAMHT